MLYVVEFEPNAPRPRFVYRTRHSRDKEDLGELIDLNQNGHQSGFSRATDHSMELSLHSQRYPSEVLCPKLRPKSEKWSSFRKLFDDSATSSRLQMFRVQVVQLEQIGSCKSREFQTADDARRFFLRKSCSGDPLSRSVECARYSF